MTAEEIKKYIFNNNQIPFVLESLGCKCVKYHANSDMYSCTNHDGDNTTAVNVKNNEHLGVKNWTRQGFDGKSDIFTLIEYIKGCDFSSAIKYLHDLMGLKFTGYRAKKKKTYEDPFYFFKQIRNGYREVNTNDINYIEDHIAEEYLPLTHIDWFREGIMPWTSKKFNLCYSYRHKRMVIPHYHWRSGLLMGLNMRTTIEGYEELGIKKYYLTPTYQKSLNVYGAYQNWDSIQKAGYVVVYESEKSVLKRDSLGDSTGVALSGKTISDEQVKILITMNVSIIIALDKDVSVNEVRLICDKFYGIRTVYYINDSWDLLSDKESPADKCDMVFKCLMNYKVEYDESEHKKYLQSLRR